MTGIVHGARIGQPVRWVHDDGVSFGPVEAFQLPNWLVRFDDNELWIWSKQTLAKHLLYEPVMLSDPRYTQFDWTFFSPRLNTMWESELRAAMEHANVRTPSCWWSSRPTPRLSFFSHRSKTDAARLRREEIARAQALLEALTNKARAPETLTASRMLSSKRSYFSTLAKSPCLHLL